MKTIAIYNNKGGVGKSTLTLFLADFFSSGTITINKRKPRVLVLDLDGQSSSATSLLGLQRVARAKAEKQNLSHLLLALKQNQDVDISKYLIKREAGKTPTRKISLGELWVMPTERASAIKLEQSFDCQTCVRLMNIVKNRLKKQFDIVLMDLPANIDERNKLSLAGLLIADHIIIPTEPTRLTLNTITDTFNMIHYVRGLGNGQGKAPKIAGILLNKADKRSKQYKLHYKELYDTAARHDTVVLENMLPTAPALSTASDDSLEFVLLRERYSTYYDKVRKIALEVAERCGYRLKSKKKSRKKDIAKAC
ncbi:MAG: hypothetical protein COB67_04115 [SAR324 cluster bacterium]|uniref:AAA domain-containing protein n=1 Tax=SAR324 cluster bacterium TaxID=2024889 RepID=A0A2A4T7E3_9DELT|nr:MAG: hypothetical protein COB67_04115 [SAR324 cluster bacterium]